MQSRLDSGVGNWPWMEAQGANSFPQSFCGGAGHAGSLVKLAPAGVTLDEWSPGWATVLRRWPLAVGCCPLLAHGALLSLGGSILSAFRVDGTFIATWSTRAPYLPGGDWEGCEHAPWLYVPETSSSRFNIWMFLFKIKVSFLSCSSSFSKQALLFQRVTGTHADHAEA